jgi:HAD superfamily hydrolase (TIGR01509 family)
VSFACAVLFDLDGVLIDTREATAAALAALAAQPLGRAVDPAEHVGLRPADALSALGVPRAARVYDAGFDAALGFALGQLRPFQAAVRGMVALAELRTVGLGVVTSQARRRLPALLPAVVADLADVVVASDDVTFGKPDPGGLLIALDALGVAPEYAMFVGDTPVDLTAAWRAGVLAVGAGWGYTGARTLEQAGAEVLLTDPAQVGPGLLAHLDADLSDAPVGCGRPG